MSGFGILGTNRPTADDIADVLEAALASDAVNLPRTQVALAGDFIDAAWYGLTETNTAAQNQVAMLAFRAAVAAEAAANGKAFAVVRPGTYNVAPVLGSEVNWAIKNLDFDAHTATFVSATDAPVFFVDGGRADAVLPQSAAGVFGAKFRFGRVFAPAVGASGSAVFFTKCHHGLIEGEVAQTNGTAFNIGFCVANKVRPVVSVNRGGFGGLVPEIGILLRQDPIPGDAGTASYLAIDTPIIEGVKVGALLQAAIGCTFTGGTIEGNSDTAVIVAGISPYNKFIGLDFEANPAGDMIISGDHTDVISCDSLTSITINGAYTNVLGGRHASVLLSGSSSYCVFDATYRAVSATNTFADAGTGNSIGRARDAQNGHRGRRYNRHTIAPSGAGYLHINQTGDLQMLTYTGGAGVLIYSALGGTTTAAGIEPNGLLYSLPGNTLTLLPGQVCDMVWTTAPDAIVIWK